MFTNYHSHTQFCDGKASIEEFIIKAIELGFSQWGVSPHSPLPMLKHAPWAIKQEEVQTYLNEVNRLKERYSDKIQILAGMEIDYLDESYNPSTEYFQNLPLDFRIGSVHLLKSPVTGEFIDIDCDITKFQKGVDYHFNGSLQRIVTAYYEAMTELVNKGGFDFLGHSDKISSNASTLSSKITQKDWYKSLVEDFLQLSAKKNVVMEINTKAYEVKGCFFPDAKYFGRMAELGIKTVINSDTHRLEMLTTGLREARGLYSGEIITL